MHIAAPQPRDLPDPQTGIQEDQDKSKVALPFSASILAGGDERPDFFRRRGSS